MQNNIVFLNQDDPRAAETLARAMQNGLDRMISLGLIVKVDHHDRIINWMLADTEWIQSLAALVLPSASSGDNQNQTR
jgi:hypothetical protein